jgi:uncharacterized protein (TIGR02646 family)
VIRVDRNLEDAPAILEGESAKVALAEAQAHFEKDDAAARQQRFAFEPFYRNRQVRSALTRLFSDKCAFCESHLDAAAATPITHHFRPTQEAIDEDGGVSRRHYWWLVYDWENIYLSCQRCATAAGAQFPVAGERAAPPGRSQLADEKPLLLDPCLDYPDEHLAFKADGTVSAESQRGETTIDVYVLNRRHLVEARRGAIEVARRAPWEGQPSNPKGPYAAAIRQVLGEEMSPLQQSGLNRMGAVLQAGVAAILPRIPLASFGSLPVRPVVVEKLELCDFRSIEQLSLELAGPDDEAPWTMLLGENGHGKTSVLQALALLLMGEEARKRLRLDPTALIRQGAESARISAQLRGAIEWRQLLIDRKNGFVVAGGDDDPCALAAYGAARIPPTQPRSMPTRQSGRPQVENLFDAATPLTGAELWLSELDQESFDFAARALRRLLLAPEDSVLEQLEGGVVMRTSEGPKSLTQLSDGYRSIIALAADIMCFFMTRYGSMDAAEGVVLVDELSAHLHPRWQMRVVEAFREAFPRLQFIATTHDPLCLRGLSGEREIVVLRRTTDGHLYALPSEEVPSVGSLRVDELLTSEVFGLNSTIDPALERDFDRYYELLGSTDRGPKAAAEIATLREKLAEYRQLGTTRRERLALEAADEYLSAEPDVADQGVREELLDSTKQQLRAIWSGSED